MCVLTTTGSTVVEGRDGNRRTVALVLRIEDDPWVWQTPLTDWSGISFPATNSATRGDVGTDDDVVIAGWNVEFGEDAVLFNFPIAFPTTANPVNALLQQEFDRRFVLEEEARRRSRRGFSFFNYVRRIAMVDLILDAFGVELGSLHTVG
jgi:hypothetical protein